MLRSAWQSIVEIPILPPLFDNGIALVERRQPLPWKAPDCPDPSGQTGQHPTAINHRKQPSINNLRAFSVSPGGSAIFRASGQRDAISGNRPHVPRSNPDRNHRSRPRRRQDSAAESCGSLEKRPQSSKNKPERQRDHVAVALFGRRDATVSPSPPKSHPKSVSPANPVTAVSKNLAPSANP